MRASRTDAAKRATCTVDSVASAADLSDCTDVVITAFTAASGATVTMTGDITFASTTASCPLITFDMDEILFNGGDHNINGNGALYWDGEGTDGGKTKPHPFVKFKGFGTFEFVTVLNSPTQAISVGTTATTVIPDITVDDCKDSIMLLCDFLDIFSRTAAVLQTLTVSSCTVNNQDDCVAINSGTAIVIEDMACIESHGISIGSIASDHSVSNVKIARNTITGGLYGLRIKVHNTSATRNDGTPGTSAPISGISFSGGTTAVSVGSDVYTLVVDCGACSGTWNFADLDATGGKAISSLPMRLWYISGGTY
ncbi:pectin lyase fold/virulence factor [Mycena sp. CBHHK59/15]|nr:pectin lyase fold/virulence factor [Mycena sp. CBHHK59/15]